MAGKRRTSQGEAQTSPQTEGGGDPTVNTAPDGLLETNPEPQPDTEPEPDAEQEPEPEIDPREIDPENGLPIGGTPVHDPHPETPAVTEIIPDATFSISIRGVSLQFRDGKRAFVEPDVLKAIKDAGVPYREA